MTDMQEISKQVEEYKVRLYCSDHQLVIPKTNVKTILIWLFIMEFLAIVLALGGYMLLAWFDISFSFLLLHSLSVICVFCLFLKKLCILFVEVYQHYVSEEIRRKCTLMPTCSEYALLALHKYNIFKALHKIYIRLTKKCNGSYILDYP